MTRSRILAVLMVAVGLLGTFAFGVRTFRSSLVLVSAYEVGMPALSSVRPWMTTGYVAEAYRVPIEALAGKLQLPSDTPPETLLRDIADERGIGVFDMVLVVQTAIAELSSAVPDDAPAPGDTSGSLTSAFLAALLTYGYPALAVVLVLGAIGAPVPTGIATVLAGSLAASGTLTLPLVTAVAITASVAGDMIGFSAGRYADKKLVARYGNGSGNAAVRQRRVETLFRRWGGVTILLTRTLVSHFSSVANILAGLGRYGFAPFILFALAGRLVWTGAYLGLGYVVGNDIVSASSFLANLTVLAIFATFLATTSSRLAQKLRPVDGAPG